MAVKVSKKSSVQTKKLKPLKSASKGSSALKKVASPAKAKSKVVSAGLKKAAAQSEKFYGDMPKSVKKPASANAKSAASKLEDAKTTKAVQKKVPTPQSSVGKNQFKQVAGQLASDAEFKAQKKNEAIQKVATGKENAKEFKARKASEDEKNFFVEKKDKKLPEPEPIFDEQAKTSAVDSGVLPVLTDAEGRPYCKVKDCDQIATVDGYCRYHYLLLWKKIQVRRKILIDGKLERYVEELTARYPDKFLEVIRKDLLTELEIDESSNEVDFEEEDTQSIEEVRSFSDSSLIEEDDF